MLIRPLRIFVAAATIVFAAGCTRTAEGTHEEQRNPYYLTGKDRLQAMDYQGAVESFERALQENPRSVLAHYELGLIYEQHLANYASAIHHYGKALKLRPEGYPADTIRLRIPACRQELAKADSLAITHPAVLRETDRLREENQELRKQVLELRATLATRPAAGASSPVLTVSGRAPTPAGGGAGSATNGVPGTRFGASGGTVGTAAGIRAGTAGAAGISGTAGASGAAGVPGAVGADGYRTHVVLPRETLASISRAHNVRLEALLAANRGLDPKRLKVGQSIKVPAKSGQR